MTRGILGILLLLVLLAGGLFVQWTMATLQEPITGELTQAAQAGARGDWDTARLHQETAQRGWRKAWRLTAAFADHQPLEDADGYCLRQRLFVGVYAAQEEEAEFAACCRELARRVRAIADAHSLTWWNLM